MRRKKLVDGLYGARNDNGIDRCHLVFIIPGNKESFELVTHYLAGMGFRPGCMLSCFSTFRNIVFVVFY